MGVFKSLNKAEEGIEEAKSRFMDGLISYHECLRAMVSAINKEYHEYKEFEEES